MHPAAVMAYRGPSSHEQGMMLRLTPNPGERRRLRTRVGQLEDPTSAYEVFDFSYF